jgi:hypothetical protein
MTFRGNSDIFHRMDRRFIAASLLLLSVGCSSTLETGYKPQPLGVSSTERRSYYASPFTAEARAAQAQRDQEFDARRPRPGY